MKGVVPEAALAGKETGKKYPLIYQSPYFVQNLIRIASL